MFVTKYAHKVWGAFALYLMRFYYLYKKSESSEKYFSAGQRLRICLTFEKTDNVLIDDINDFNDIDLELLDSNGNVVASSFTGVDNVVVIDYIIPESGYYTFKTSSYRYIQDDNLDYYYSWYAY